VFWQDVNVIKLRFFDGGWDILIVSGEIEKIKTLNKQFRVFIKPR